jgi:hypothetical protein
MNLNATVRRYIYGISVALVPLLIGYGLFTSEQGTLILNVVAAVLAVGNSTLALNNIKED